MEREFTTEEYQELDGYLEKAGFSRGDCKFYFDDDTYLAHYSDEFDRLEVMDETNMLKELTPSIVHELTHRDQRQALGWLWYNIIGYRLPFCWYPARWTIEPAAIKNEQTAERALGVESLSGEY